MLSDQGILERIFTDCPNRMVDDLIEEQKDILEKTEVLPIQPEYTLLERPEEISAKQPVIPEREKERMTKKEEKPVFAKKSFSTAKGVFENKEAVDERWLMKEMVYDLPALRQLIGISAAELGAVLNLDEEQYREIEAGESPMDWSRFLSILFFFCYNKKTAGVVEALGLYPRVLRKRMMLGTGGRYII